MRIHVTIPAAAALIGGALIVVACYDADPVRPGDPDGFSAALELVSVPFMGVTQLTLLPPQAPPPGRCSDPAADVLSSMTGTMKGTHVGNAIVVGSHCLDYATLMCSDGRLTVTAANGDLLFGTYSCTSGALEGSIASWTDEVGFTGGTGRFTGANGGAVESGWVDYATGVGASRMSGTLDFTASDQAQH